MSKRLILCIDPIGLEAELKQGLEQLNPSLELRTVGDGAECIQEHARCCQAGVPPLLTVIPETIELVSGRHVALTLRTVEQKLGVGATAIIYLRPADAPTDEAKQWGRAVSIKETTGDDPRREATRLTKAIGKVLGQLSKRNRS